MNKIRSWLYIGKYKETRNFYQLSKFKITSMLLLAELVEHPGITSRYLAVDDGVPLPTNLLREGVQFVIDEKKRVHTILVACGAGISRSATFATAVLKEVEQISLSEAFQIVKQNHPEAMPHPALWKSLCTFYNEAVSWRSIEKQNLPLHQKLPKIN